MPKNTFKLGTTRKAGFTLFEMLISLAIIISLGSRFFVIGVLLLIWAATSQLIIPIGKGFSFLSSSPRLQRNRPRAVAFTALAVGLAGLFFFVMPFPLRTVAEGITWPSERSQIRAGTDCFIGRILVANGSQVEPRQPLIEAYDPFLDARVEVLEAQLRGLRRQYTAVRATDQAEAAVLQEEIKGVVSDLERARERPSQGMARPGRACLTLHELLRWPTPTWN